MRMRTLQVFFLSPLILLTPQPAASQEAPARQQAIDLMRNCQGRGHNYRNALESNLPDPDFFGTFDLAECVTYMAGISDANVMFSSVGKGAFFCLPNAGISGEQQIMVFLNWTKDHPERLHESRRTAVISAFSTAFPCAK